MKQAQPSHVVELDALRGIAILGVVMTHVVNSLGMMGNDLPVLNLDITQLLNTGGLGVELFFLLSGFLLTITESRRYAAGKGSVRAYALRRVLRLAPAFYLALAIRLVYALWQGTYHPGINPGLDLLLYLSFLHGLAYGFGSDLDPAYWSLTVEVVFYVSLPFILRYARPLRTRLVCYLATVVIAAVVYTIYAHTTNMSLQYYLLFHPLAHLHLFLAGSILATLAERRRVNGRRLRLPAGTGDFLLLFGVLAISLNAYINGVSPAAHVLSRLGGESYVALGLAAYVVGSPLLSLVLRFPGLAALGRISYSVFLFHGLLLNLAEQAGWVRLLRSWAASGVPHLALFSLYIAATLLVIVPICALSYRYVELPGMRGFRPARRAPIQPVAA